MKKVFGWTYGFIFLLIGCSTFTLGPENYPVYTYQQPYDVVYLKTYEALDRNQDWTPELTDKSKGIIEFRAIQPSTLFDLDDQNARFLIKMVSRTETSMELDRSNSKCKGDSCLKLLNSVHEMLSHLPVRKIQPVQPE